MPFLFFFICALPLINSKKKLRLLDVTDLKKPGEPTCQDVETETQK